jgi:multimeric flavodoxin WrbA
MKAIAINGSPRKEGNTSILLNRVLAPLNEAGWETELIQLGGKPVRGCMACTKCFETKDMQCIIKNDIINDVIAKMVEADAVIIGTPTYFANVSTEIKALIDRAGYVTIANGKPLKGKVGAPVVAVRRAGAIPAFDAINHFMHLSQMIMPGSTYWNLGIGRLPGEVEGDEEGHRNMENLGKVIDWLTKITKPSLDSFPA